MGFLGRRPKPKGRALTAAGQRVVPKTAVELGTHRRDWARQSWAYRDAVPELRYFTSFVSQQLSRVRWFVAEAGPEGREPRQLYGEPIGKDEEPSEVSIRTQRVAIDALQRLDMNSRGSSMAGRAAENFELAGECYLLGELNELGAEEWTIRSSSEVKIGRDGDVQLVEPGRTQGRALDLNSVELFRLWHPSPEYSEWADAKITACMGVLEEIVIYDRQARAAARSRISSGSILYLPEELSLCRAGGAPVDVAAPGVDDGEGDLFMEEFTAAMLQPISSDEDPSAVVPLVVRGPAMGPEGQAMRSLIGTIQIPREEVKDSIAKREAAVTTLAHGLDIPPEVISGLGSADHWSSWTVGDATVRQHLIPRCENFADSLTASYLRETCLAQNCPSEEVARLCIWFDATELSQPADPLGNAKDLWDRDAISDETLVKAGGLDKADMPTPREKISRMLAGGRITPQAVPLIVALEASGSEDPALQQAVHLAEQMAVPTTQLPGASSKRTVIDYGNGKGPSRPSSDRPTEAAATPQSPLPRIKGPQTLPDPRSPGKRVAVTASGSPQWAVNEGLCRQLGQVDAQTVAELAGFIDAAILDVVRQAANRIRTGAQRSGAPAAEKAMFASARSEPIDPVAVVAAAGPDARWTVSDEQALAGALDKIKPRWFRAVSAAGRKIAALLKKLLGRDPSGRLLQEFERRASDAWPRLAQAIHDAAVRRLHGGGPEDGPVLPRSVLTDALTEVGGVPDLDYPAGGDRPPATGMSSGQSVIDEINAAGAADVGREWAWGDNGHPSDPFAAHVDLDGTRFQSFSDEQLTVRPEDSWLGVTHYRPGDHAGCCCGTWLYIAAPRVNRSDDPAAAERELEQLRQERRAP